MAQEKSGVLLVNLGTPEAPTSSAVKRYLSQFLHDRRVVDLPRVLWCPLLHGIILPFRAPRVAKLYQSIWMSEGSPLLVYSRRQATALAERLNGTPVELGMSYGQPALEDALACLLEQGVTRLIVLPLYPQYSCSTTAAVWDGIARALRARRQLPTIQFIHDYAEEPLYIAALCHSIQSSFAEHGEPDKLLLSFHGIPQRYAQEGDEYPQRCEATTRAVREKLGWSEERILMTYQSRFGREPWLMPYTDQTLAQLPQQGCDHLQIVCPGFAADCLETLEEIQEQNREIFLSAGGKKFHYIAALNDHPMHIDAMEALVRPYL